MARCGYCDTDLPSSGEFVKCYGCGNGFCFSCSVKENAYRNMSEEKKKTWRCPHICKKVSGPKQSTDTETPKTTVQDMSKKSDRQLLEELVCKISRVENTLETVQKSQQFMSDQYDELIKDIRDLKEENKSLVNEVKGLKRQLDEKNNEIESLQTKINDLDQYGRRVNLEITGLKNDDGKDTMTVLENLAPKIGVNFKKEDVHAAHPLRNRSTNRPTTILVQFVSRAVRDTWLMQGRKALRGEAHDGGRVYFNENLTPYNRNLLRESKLKARGKQYAFTWVKNGKMFVRKGENQPILHITSIKDLDKIV